MLRLGGRVPVVGVVVGHWAWGYFLIFIFYKEGRDGLDMDIDF